MTQRRDRLRFARRVAASAIALAALWASQACVAQADTCPDGLTACGEDLCSDLKKDPANCGKCGNACTTGQVCSGGTCGIACGSGMSRCGNTCVNLQTDAKNCGACGNVCKNGQECNHFGECECPSHGPPCGTVCCDFGQQCVQEGYCQ